MRYQDEALEELPKLEVLIGSVCFLMTRYSLNPTNDYKTLEETYNKAKFIMSVSKDITECLKISFPRVEKKIFKINLSVDSNKFTRMSEFKFPVTEL